MRIDRLVRNDLSPAGFIWYRSYLEAMDAKDLDAFSALIAEDCVLHINSAPPVEGKSAILMHLGPMWEQMPQIEHDLLNIIGSDNHFALEAYHHYRQGERSVTIRAAAVTDRDDAGKARSISLYFDPSPLKMEQQR